VFEERKREVEGARLRKQEEKKTNHPHEKVLVKDKSKLIQGKEGTHRRKNTKLMRKGLSVNPLLSVVIERRKK